ncbi:MAG: putative zinc-binding metallopeptidase [Pirellulales bacterium]
MPPSSRSTAQRSPRTGQPARPPKLSSLSDEQLLQMRICDLGVKIPGTRLQERIDRLYEELEYREIMFRPHCWLADDWYSPDGVPGIAIPFYLAHPRLMRLERKQVFEVEGGSESWCLRILRHEAGHTIDTAYQLHRRRRWQQLFGKTTQPYPDHYQPKPYSKSFVLHLDMWYAQRHPAEDFAETFAIWLKPRSRWRKQYEGWTAFQKLEYVDELMNEIRDQKPRVSSREHVDPARRLRKTLAEHYQEKRARYGIDTPTFTTVTYQVAWKA